MTTGSWSTLRTVTIATDCSGASQRRNGTTVSWSGGDSPKLIAKGQNRTFRERLVLFHKDPTVLPNGRPKPVKVDGSRVALDGLPNNLFDASRTKRIRDYDQPSSGSDEYGTPHNYTKSWVTYAEPSAFPWYYGNGQYAGTCTISAGGFDYDSYLGTPWTADHDYKLLSRLRSKVVGSEFNLASFLGAEGLDTLKFMTDTANRIYRSMIAVRKLDFRQAHRVLSEWGRYRNVTYLAGKRRREQEDIYRELLDTAAGRNRGQGWWSVPASTYLEWHLAVEPLLKDCVAAAEQLAHITQMPRTMKVTASVTARRVSTDAMVYTGPVWVGARTVRKSVVAYFVHTPPPVDLFGFQDPEVTLWNALPLSFVADYFYNIGGFLEARAIAKALPQGTFITTVKDDTNLTACKGRKASGNWSQIISSSYQASQKQRRGSLTRTISTSLTQNVSVPDVKPLGLPSSWQQAATVASLIATFSDRHAKRPPLR